MFIYPVGIPVCYAFLLFRFRHHINPIGCSDELHALRVRRERQNTHPELRAMDFLFSCYRPGAWWFEVFDSVRRIFMTGLVRYVAKTSGPPVAGILLSLVSTIVFREMQPYENPSTNALATFGQWQLLSTYLVAYALLVELQAAGENKLVLIGTLLVGVLSLAPPARAALSRRPFTPPARAALSRRPLTPPARAAHSRRPSCSRTSPRFSSPYTSKSGKETVGSRCRSRSPRMRCARPNCCTNRSK